MHRAQLFPEVGNFLLRLRQRQDRVFIVSHKTEFGHNDPAKIPLREEALRWMQRHGFFDPNLFGMSVEHVFFAETREDKAAKISELQCDCFIDDLWEVFAESRFPAGTKRILFREERKEPEQVPVDLVSHSWRDISRFLFGEEREKELKQWVISSMSIQPRSVSRLKGRANSSVYRVKTEDDCYALKWYPDLSKDCRERLLIEKQACEFLHSQNVHNVLQVVEAVPELNLTLFRWINGEPVTDVQDSDIGQALKFIEILHTVRCNENAVRLPQASEACLSIEAILKQVDQKRSKVLGAGCARVPLNEFFEKWFNPVYRDYLAGHEEQISTLRGFGKLSRRRQILSPSDFGFHNSLRQSNGALFWLDFEYFGWDDPVKLISDFLWHPGHSLSFSQRKIWLEGCLEIFSEDRELLVRLKTCFPLFGLRWSLIVLNVFSREHWVEPDYRHRQLSKAKQYVSQVSESLRTRNDVCNEL
jgi:thiamine kinase-like enzyme